MVDCYKILKIVLVFEFSFNTISFQVNTPRDVCQSNLDGFLGVNDDPPPPPLRLAFFSCESVCLNYFYPFPIYNVICPGRVVSDQTCFRTFLLNHCFFWCSSILVWNILSVKLM